MEQPDHMIDIVIIFSVNFCPCKIRYQVKNLWDQWKGTKKGPSILKIYNLKKKIFFQSKKSESW